MLDLAYKKLALLLIVYDINWLSGTGATLYKKLTLGRILYKIDWLKTISPQSVQKFVRIGQCLGAQIATNRSGFSALVSSHQKFCKVLFAKKIRLLALCPSPWVPAKTKFFLKHHSLASLLRNRKATAMKEFLHRLSSCLGLIAMVAISLSFSSSTPFPGVWQT